MSSSAAVTMALALGVGSLISVVSDRLRVPALLPMLAAGLLLGRSGIGVVDAESLGPLLSPLITLGIGLLIFEGALHLGWRELRKAPRAVGGLLTVGALLTWALSTLAAVWVLGMGVAAAILLGAMLTVTGPTVVQPILRRVRVTARLRTALSAEAVLIDPIGVLLTIVVLTTLKGAAVTPVSPSMLYDGARHLGFQVATGAAVGICVGALGLVLGRGLSTGGRIQPQILNLLAVGVCMLAIGAGEFVTAEAGLVAATVAAILLGNLRIVGVAELHLFKQQLATLTVGSLFILLAARFDASTLAHTGVAEVLFIAALIFVVRPLSSGAALIGSHLERRERIFTALFAPRGIVALSVAVISAEDLARFARAEGDSAIAGAIVHLDRLASDASSFERVMFLVIAGTVCWASLVGPLLARVLRVGGSRPTGVLLIGGHALSIQTGVVLRRLGVDVTLLDSRYDHAMRADAAGVPTVRGDATDLRWVEEQVGCEDVGLVLAWTGNSDVDFTAARWAGERFGKEQSGVWASGQVPGDPGWTELGGGRLLDEIFDEINEGRYRVESWTRADPTAIPFMMVNDGRPQFIIPGGSVPEPKEGGSVTLVGLVRPATAGEPEAAPS